MNFNKIKHFLCLILLIFIVTSCNKDKPMLFLSSKPITAQTFSFDSSEVVFDVASKINVIAVNPKTFKSNKMRLQVIKLNEKVQLYGYSLEHARDIEINPEKKYFISNFYIHNTGYYILRIFGHDNLKTPLVKKYFWVK